MGTTRVSSNIPFDPTNLAARSGAAGLYEVCTASGKQGHLRFKQRAPQIHVEPAICSPARVQSRRVEREEQAGADGLTLSENDHYGNCC